MKKVFLIIFSLLLVSCGKTVMEPQTQYVLGTVCTVNLFEDGSEELYQDIFEALNAIDNKFSVNKEYSEISKVNQSAGSINAVNVSQEVFEVMTVAKKIARATENSFNPALGTLIKLWGIGTDSARIPSDDEIEEALKHCDPDSIILSEVDGSFKIQILDAKTQIDLGAIVKGYASDCIAELLEKRNVKKAIIDLGGNIYVFGNKSENPDDMWRVGIRNPIDPDAQPVEIVSLKSGSVVTSGNYERFFEKDGKRYHHILDSRTGRPAETDLASVSVISDKSIYCDALATAFFVAGKSGVFEDILDLREIKTVFVDLSGKTVVK